MCFFTFINYAAIVKDLIDSNTCAAVSANSNCGTAAESYYETFEYNGQRVIIVSGAPNHLAETDACCFLEDGAMNPNTRCKYFRVFSHPCYKHFQILN